MGHSLIMYFGWEQGAYIPNSQAANGGMDENSDALGPLFVEGVSYIGLRTIRDVSC